MVYARLRLSVTVDQAKAEMARLATRFAVDELKSSTGWSASVISLQDYLVDASTRDGLILLMAVVGCVLLIACANVASLLIARSVSRAKEFAVRTALGAGRWRLVRQLLAESLLLALLGGGMGLLLAFWGVTVLRAGLSFNSVGAWLATKTTIDANVLEFTLAVSVVTSLLFGLAPALHVSSRDLHSALKEGGRTGSAGIRQRLRSGLVVSEVALALVLLTSAGLIIKSLDEIMRINAGFEPKRVLTASLSLSNTRYRDAVSQAAFSESVVQRVANLPGVRFAGVTTDLPVSFARTIPFSVEGQPVPKPEDRPQAKFYAVSRDYLRAMSVPLLQGREFTPADSARAPAVALVNRALIERFFPKGDAIGKHLTVDARAPAPASASRIFRSHSRILALRGACSSCVWSRLKVLGRSWPIWTTLPGFFTVRASR